MQPGQESASTSDAEHMPRSRFLRDVLIFQGKLLLDAFKDVLLGPASLIAAVVDLARPAPRSQLLFYRILDHGKDAERAIDLFSAVSRGPDGGDRWTVDDMIAQVETRLTGDQSATAASESDDGRDLQTPRTRTTKGEEE